jgi:DNA-binding CsgD family transcriptional regulator
MRRHDPDVLTSREREVLELIRVGLTNEEIARRLGITLDGAKYHVSQILSKLGVATREEAAAWRPEERRAWWARWPVWAKIVGAATVVAAVAGLGVLAWGLLGTEEEHEETTVSQLTREDLYNRVEQAVTRPGFVLHSYIEIRTQVEGGSDDASATLELWVDASNERIRYGLHAFEASQLPVGAEPFTALLDGNTIYTRNDSGEITESETPRSSCPGTDSLLVSSFLLCDDLSSSSSVEARVEPHGEYEGESTVAFVLEASYATTLPGGPLPPPTRGTVPPTEPARAIETRNTSRTHIAIDTFLPLVRIYEIRQDGELHDTSAWVYEHEFIPVDDLPADFFEVASLSITSEDSPTS